MRLHLREPEIKNLGGAVVRDFDVGRLQVTVDDPFLMRRLERIGDLPRGRQRFPDLELVETDWPPLSRLGAGQQAVVAEVSDEDPALLRYVGSLGLYPGTRFSVVDGPPYDGGPVTVRLLAGPEAGAEHSVGERAAAHVFVRDIR